MLTKFCDRKVSLLHSVTLCRSHFGRLQVVGWKKRVRKKLKQQNKRDSNFADTRSIVGTFPMKTFFFPFLQEAKVKNFPLSKLYSCRLFTLLYLRIKFKCTLNKAVLASFFCLHFSLACLATWFCHSTRITIDFESKFCLLASSSVIVNSTPYFPSNTEKFFSHTLSQEQKKTLIMCHFAICLHSNNNGAGWRSCMNIRLF